MMKKIIVTGLILLGGYLLVECVVNAIDGNYEQQYKNMGDDVQ